MQSPDQPLTANNLYRWQAEYEHLYASKTVEGVRLSLSARCDGVLVVRLGDDMLYVGPSLYTAVGKYNRAAIGSEE